MPSSSQTNPSYTDKRIAAKYLALGQNGNSIATYIWIDGSGEHLRSKTMTLDFVPKDSSELPVWSVDGSSCDLAEPGLSSDIYLKPCALFNDPHLPGNNNKLVLCETYNSDGTPHQTNHRHRAAEVFEQTKSSVPWFGLEQEYSILDRDGIPFGWPKPPGCPKPQGPYFCSIGANNAFGRDIVDSHYKACLYAGIQICGTNAEIKPSQWEFQIGICNGIDAGDHLWMARYILVRIAEEFGLMVTFDPKPVMSGDWNGAGCHANYSTVAMRDDGGFAAIEAAIEKLSKRHKTHIRGYDPKGGLDNLRRLSGKHDTSSIETFSWGVYDGKASICIPRQVDIEKKGYMEDRRPAANADPYLVTGLLVRTTLLDETDD